MGSMIENVGNDQVLLSKIATSNHHGENSEYFEGWKAYDRDPYHPTNNPNGVIQMGLAENQVSACPPSRRKKFSVLWNQSFLLFKKHK